MKFSNITLAGYVPGPGFYHLVLRDSWAGRRRQGRKRRRKMKRRRKRKNGRIGGIVLVAVP